MSPPWVVGALEAGVAGVERDSTIERLIEPHFCSREAEALVFAARRAEASLASQTTKRFATERKAFDLGKFFAKMVIVEADVLGACQLHDRLSGGFGQATMAGPAAVGDYAHSL